MYHVRSTTVKHLVVDEAARHERVGLSYMCHIDCLMCAIFAPMTVLCVPLTVLFCHRLSCMCHVRSTAVKHLVIDQAARHERDGGGRLVNNLCLGFRVQESILGVGSWGVRCSVVGVGCGVYGVVCRVWGVGLRVGFRVQDSILEVGVWGVVCSMRGVGCGM